MFRLLCSAALALGLLAALPTAANTAPGCRPLDAVTRSAIDAIADAAVGPGAAGPLKVGYGLRILDLQGYLGHNGAILGYSSVAFYRPDIDTTIAVLGNRSTNFSTPAIPKKLNPELFPKA